MGYKKSLEYDFALMEFWNAMDYDRGETFREYWDRMGYDPAVAIQIFSDKWNKKQKEEPTQENRRPWECGFAKDRAEPLNRNQRPWESVHAKDRGRGFNR